ncbi:30S ribosome-binding factor RbfA [Novispirillum itersonii]|uniref:30S ribosome-binding factor RbfA n=1 Tax=Novispirillum itersonii TaxID=189 RepID=UPI000370833A|nr:30S ribosome-binding factor RbfA [Novispirillum itersonii]
MIRPGNQAPTQRQLRVNEEIRHALAWVLERGQFRDPVLASTPITVTEVRCSPDLRNATVFFTPLGGQGNAEAVREALTRAQSYLRHELSRTVEMRYLPRLSFQVDTSFDEYARIDSLLHRPDVIRDTASVDEDDAEGQDEDAEEGDRHDA